MHVIASLLLASLATVAVDTAPPTTCAARKAGATPQAFVAIAPETARDTVVRATVCVTLAAKSDAKVGSYHGELYFDSLAVAAVRVQKPAGGMRVENTTIPGRVNFAGAAPAGFPPGALVQVVLRLKQTGARPAVRLQMLELNSTDGVDLMKQLPQGTP